MVMAMLVALSIETWRQTLLSLTEGRRYSSMCSLSA
jgi:hypothetical protein